MTSDLKCQQCFHILYTQLIGDTIAERRERLASFFRLFHALYVVVDELFKYSMSVEVINNVMTSFCSIFTARRERFGSKISNRLHHTAHVT